MNRIVQCGAFVSFFLLACSSPRVEAVTPATKVSYAAYLPRQCEENPSPLFRGVQPNDVFEAELISNFDLLNSVTSTASPQKAVMRYIDDNGATRFVGALVRESGNLRANCEYKPLRMEFESEQLMARIEAEVARDAGERDQHFAIYKKYLSTPGEASEKKGIPQQGNIFSHLGDDMKIITHCGVHNWSRVGGANKKEQRTHLLQEFLLYQLLKVFETTTFQTRLAKLTYRNADGRTLGTFPAFFREPKSELAQRCGLRIDKNMKGDVNKISYLSFHLLNFITMNEEFEFPRHNVGNLKDNTGVRFLIAQDFDLSELSNPDYYPQKEPVVTRFVEWMSDFEYDDMAIVQALNVLAHESELKNLVHQSALDDPSKMRTLDWLDTAFRVVGDFIYARPVEELNHMEEIRESLGLQGSI